MENSKSVKALKKQLAAAIAMVVVAGIALGSSTYAWFVSNNSVTATTTKISAQSNSAYLVIANNSAGKTSNASTNAATADDVSTTTKLYPAQWKNNFSEDGTLIKGSGIYQFESAYASKKDDAAEKDGTRFCVGDPATACHEEYALLNTFYIGTGEYDGEFTNLKVSDLSVTTGVGDGLKTAMRLLIMTYAPTKSDGGVSYDTTPTGWAVAKYNGTGLEIESQSDNKTDGVVYAPSFGKAEGDVKVEMYLYYDGSDENVKTTNLANLTDIGATVTFEATAKEYGKLVPQP